MNTTKVKELAKAKGLSVHKLEVELGWANGTIGKWEKGISPSVVKAKELADFFNVRIEELMDDT